ncbi:hypothetical protein J6590_025218 [Homalodisca vitripennis]|nr:hypothetical protein J6590_025218 [Homalodisca vitripennis]
MNWTGNITIEDDVTDGVYSTYGVQTTNRECNRARVKDKAGALRPTPRLESADGQTSCLSRASKNSCWWICTNKYLK